MAKRFSWHHFLILTVILVTTTSGLKETQNERMYLGLCQLYNGTYCEDILNSTEMHFVNTTLGFNNTEKLTVALGKQLDIVFQYSSQERIKKCKHLMKQVICYYVFPLCSNDGKRLEYCREDCGYLFSICGAELNKLVGAGKSILYGKASGLIFRFDECKEFMSEKDNSEKNGSCKHLPFIDVPRKKQSDEMSSTILIIIIVCVAVAVVFLLLALVFYRRMLYHKSRSHSVHYEESKDHDIMKTDRLSNVVSMRDRIREWKVAPSELIELVDICKSRGVQEIPVDNIEYLKDLGSGQYGLVFQGKVLDDIEGETSPIVAVKTLREGSSQEAIKEFCQEVNIMSTFSHPNVVKLIGVSLAGEPYCMIFEFVEFGDLASFLRNCSEVEDDSNSSYPKLTVTDQLAMSQQVAFGMKYISSIRCVHRDLAARNCLVGRGLVVKISDFGLSRDVYASEYYRMDKTRMLPVRWLPPEAFVDGKFTTYSDVYSYGVLLWEIFTFAKLPYEDFDNGQAMELILEGQLLKKPEECPDPIYDVMMKCWQANPEKRLPFPDIINELCSLDDYGQRFKLDDDQVIENFKGRLSPNDHVAFQKQNSSLSYSNNSFTNDDEPPINVERLPAKPPPHYSQPMMGTGRAPDRGTKVDYDGVVTLSETAGQNYSGPARGDVEGPRAVHSLTPPMDTGVPSGSKGTHGRSNGIPGDHSHFEKKPRDITHASSRLLNEDIEEPEETYQVPPGSPGSGMNGDSEGQEEMYTVPPVPQHANQRDLEEPQETYDIPPTSHVSPHIPEGDNEESQETYDVPPSSHSSLHGPPMYPDEPQETYDVPPAPTQRPMTTNGGIKVDDEGPQETYDVPPKHLEVPDDVYQNASSGQTGHYSIPASPYFQRRAQETDNASLYSNQSTLPSRKNRHSYENVDFDGKPLIC